MYYKKTYLLLMYFLFLVTNVANSQENFKYKTIPTEFDYYLSYSINQIKLNNLKKIKLKVKNKDHTEELQKLINQHKNILLPNHSIYINKNGISLNDNSVLIGQPNTKLIMLANEEIDFAVINIENVTNIQIKNIHIIGDKNKRNSEIRGEWGHGISIKNSENIIIEGVKIEKTIGDGIYIGQINNKPSENIIVSKTVIDNVRRNGVSITSGKNIILDSLFVSNTNGTDPMYGIDIEPNNNRDFIQNIKLRNIITYNNKNGGLNININKLGKGENQKDISVFVDNYKDFYSHTGFYLSNITIGIENLSGIIKLNNFNLYYNHTPFKFKSSTAKNVSIKVKNIDWKHQYRKAFIKEKVLPGLIKRKDLEYIENGEN